jgi:acetyl-CoA acetyltransferase
MSQSLRGKTAVVGIGESGIGKSPGWDSLELLGSAVSKALDDAGLTLADIDGLCTGSFYHYFPSLSVAEYLGVRPKWSDSDMIGGPSFMNHLIHAAAAIETGLCETVLICYGSNARSSRNLNGNIETPQFEKAYHYQVPISAYALAASRHMYEYGTTREQMAEVAVSARKWGQLTPGAFARDPLTVEDVLASRFVNPPITALDCCLMTDGGTAMIVTSVERAADRPQKPVFFLGGAAALWHREISQMADLTVTPAVESGARAFEMAGICTGDIDVVELYDAFTINTILFLEDLGFCPKGEGGKFVSSGRIAPGGELPVNTNGGGLSYGHPNMYGSLCMIEAVKQLRGGEGERQIEGAEIAIAHGNGAALSAQVTTVFGTATTL